ncbi:MAG: hypothetical protein AAGD00_01110 [Planctomycetota bacterium]
MTNDRVRKGVMLGVVLLLVALVGVDRLGLLTPDDDAPASARSAFLVEASALESDRALVDARPAWASLARETDEQIARLQTIALSERTPELAQGRMRDMVVAAVTQLGLDRPRTSAVDLTRANAERERVQIIALRVDLTATNPREIFSVIDRLENMREPRLHVASVELSGPGLAQIPRQVDATLRVEAIVLLREQNGGAS